MAEGLSGEEQEAGKKVFNVFLLGAFVILVFGAYLLFFPSGQGVVGVGGEGGKAGLSLQVPSESVAVQSEPSAVDSGESQILTEREYGEGGAVSGGTGGSSVSGTGGVESEGAAQPSDLSVSPYSGSVSALTEEEKVRTAAYLEDELIDADDALRSGFLSKEEKDYLSSVEDELIDFVNALHK